MNNKISLAVVGATSLKGEAFIAKLAEAGLELSEVFLLDDEKNAGEHVEFGRKDKLVKSARDFDFSNVQHVVFAGEASLTEQLYPAIEKSGCAIIDASGFLGKQDDVSLATLQPDYDVASVIAVPEATTMQLWIVLQMLLQETSLANLQISLLQCAAQGGKTALEEVGKQTARLLSFQDAQPAFFEKQLAFNVIPQVGLLSDNGDTEQESVIKKQISRLFVLPENNIDITMIWTPVFFGDVATISLQTHDVVDMGQLLTQWKANPLIVYADKQVHTPVIDASGKNVVYLSRVRSWQTADAETHLSFCCMADPVQLSATIILLVLKKQLLD